MVTCNLRYVNISWSGQQVYMFCISCCFSCSEAWWLHQTWQACRAGVSVCNFTIEFPISTTGRVCDCDSTLYLINHPVNPWTPAARLCQWHPLLHYTRFHTSATTQGEFQVHVVGWSGGFVGQGGHQVGPMNFAIWVGLISVLNVLIIPNMKVLCWKMMYGVLNTWNGLLGHYAHI